jgi:hypothetical protein
VIDRAALNPTAIEVADALELLRLLVGATTARDLVNSATYDDMTDMMIASNREASSA